ACDHGVSLAPCDEFECFTDRVRACRTCRHCCAVRSFRTVLDGDLAACHIRDHHRHEERAHAPRPTLVEYFEAVFQRLDAADAGTHPDTHPLSLVIIYLKSAVANRFIRSHHRVLSEAVHTARFPLSHIIFNIKIFQPTANMNIIITVIKAGDFAYTTYTIT